MAIVINGSTGITATESSSVLGDNAVETADIAANAVTAAKLASGAAVSNIGYTPANQSNVMGRNRIINGDMRIDQRNAGASVTPTSSAYTLDRWQATIAASSKISVQQSSTAPVGFKNSLLVTSLAATTVGSTDFYLIQQKIEGYNMADLDWGTANAKTVTLSFWVRSSLTGTFGGSLGNNAFDRTYPFTYTISSANTWEQKSVTIVGDTSGTWLSTNGVGIQLTIGLGSGATYSGTAGAWAGTGYQTATGATQVVATNGATFYITGVQLEVGSVATEFERRPYGTELALCQRYYYMVGRYENSSVRVLGTGFAWSSTEMDMTISLPVTMRTDPSIHQGSGTEYFRIDSPLNKLFDSWGGIQYFSGNTVNLYKTGLSSMTAGQCSYVYARLSGAFLGLDAEL